MELLRVSFVPLVLVATLWHHSFPIKENPKCYEFLAVS